MYGVGNFRILGYVGGFVMVFEGFWWIFFFFLVYLLYLDCFKGDVINLLMV